MTLSLSIVYRYCRMKMVPHPLFILLQAFHMLFTLAEMFFSSSNSKFLPVLRNTRVHVSSFIKTSLIPEAKSSLAPLTLLALAPLSPRCNHWSWAVCIYHWTGTGNILGTELTSLTRGLQHHQSSESGTKLASVGGCVGLGGAPGFSGLLALYTLGR